MAPTGVKRYQNRPSRLLNLNKSSSSQKEITAANATASPLLMLPREIRCRIYDYVFGGTFIRVSSHVETDQSSKRIAYRISNCSCMEEHTQLSPRVRYYERDTRHYEVYTNVCQGCMLNHARQASAHEALSLPVLQVSRQIYHEAVLKPFERAFFSFDHDDETTTGGGMQAFMKALVPAQAKAITSLRLPGSPAALRPATLSSLKGLKHLRIQLFSHFLDSDANQHITDELAAYVDVGVVARLNLKSIQFELGLEGSGPRRRELAALIGRTCKTPSEDDAKILEESLEHIEASLLQPAS